MTIGPEPIRQIDSRSGRLGKTVSFYEFVDQVPGVVRARAGLGVELHRARAQLWEVEPLDGAVVERDVRRLARLARLDGEPVVLARDEHAAGCAMDDGVVRTAMAEWELERAVARGEREQLVAEADAEQRHPAEECAHGRDLARERLRVAGAVREQDAVVAGERVGVRVVRKDGDRGAGPREPVENRALAAVVDDRDPGRTRVAEDVRLARRDRLRERTAGHPRLRPDRGQRLADRRLPRDDRRAHRAAPPQVEHERPRVDSGQGRNALAAQPVGPPRPASLTHDDGARVHAPRLRAYGRDAVVADHRRREGDDLLRVAGIGDDLLVTGHRRREDGLAEAGALRTDGLAPEQRPVLEEQEAGHAASYARRPAATVARTRPRSVSPISHEFVERERNPSSCTRQPAAVSSSTRFASAPTAIRG